VRRGSAADAVLETSGAATSRHPIATSSDRVVVRWQADVDEVTLAIEEEGAGLLNPANLFIPFYTTKPNGSGVGLVLSRLIAEAHSGTIEIKNRLNT
jgi:two-component system nitrogen regulation sensor histidine kinase NtrY